MWLEWGLISQPLTLYDQTLGTWCTLEQWNIGVREQDYYHYIMVQETLGLGIGDVCRMEEHLDTKVCSHMTRQNHVVVFLNDDLNCDMLHISASYKQGAK